jgi:hypothetical protein
MERQPETKHVHSESELTLRVMLVRLLAVVAVGAALSACGGSQDAPSPKLPATLANDLAGQSEAIAASIDSGDGCRAADQARRLQQAVERAIATNDVPPVLQGPLRAAVNRVVTDVAPLCEPPAPQEKEESQVDEQAVSCNALEAQKKELEERKREIEETFKDDKDERERRKKAIEEEKKALEEETRQCREEQP